MSIYSQVRLNALFLSHVFDDADTMRHLVHKESDYIEPVISGLLYYYQNKDLAKMLNKFENIGVDDQFREIDACFFEVIDAPKDMPQDNPYFVKDEEGFLMCLKDLKHTPSKWCNLELYDKKSSVIVVDEMWNPKIERFYDGVVPIDVLRETLELCQTLMVKKPKSKNQELNLLLSSLYEDETFNEALFTKTLTLLNKKGFDADAIALINQKSKKIFASIDYHKQRGFYKTQTCEELLKFSYLTTFGNHDKKEMGDYIKQVQSAGDWIEAHAIITETIAKSSRDFTGLNGNLIELATIRPLKNDCSIPILKKYHREDSQFIKSGYLALSRKMMAR